MLRGIYSVANAMEVAAHNQEIVSENLVNATTPGYRRQGLLFEANPAYSLANSPDETPAPQGSKVSPYLYLEPGSLQQTNNPLDAAVTGNAFFVVQGPTGPLYTRNGSFEIGPDGQLQTRGGGYRVSSQGGALSVPPTAANITIASDGTVGADGVSLGRLQLASFTKSDSLRRVGPTLFEGDNPQTPTPDAAKVQQGYRESSNVQPVQEMMSMMLGMRYYEAAGKALQAITDAVSQNTRPSQS
jgi:flagellar basal-body rod protein FlgF